MHSPRPRLLARACALLALVLLFTPALLFAHARLLRSDPPNDGEVAPPSEIRLWFSEQPDLHFSRVNVLDSLRRPLEVGPLSLIQPNGMRVPLPARLPPGRYVVTWTTAASDGHMTQGSFRFRVKQDSTAGQTAAIPAPAPRITIDTTHRAPRSRDANAVITPGSKVAASSAVRWAEFVALLTVIGAIVFRLVVLPAAKWPDDLVAEGADRARRFAVAFAILFIIATITRALAQSELLAQPMASRAEALRTLVSSTHWGVAWAIGAVGAVVALIGLIVARIGLAGWVIAAIGVIAITVSEGLTGHSGASHHQALAMAADVAHQLAAGAWIGGLACALVAGVPATRRLGDADARFAGSRLVRAYHASALESVALVVLSGVVAAAIRLRAFSDLWTTPYGSMLFRKLVFVAVVLGFGYFHWRRVVIPDWDADTRFRFARSAAFELIAAAVVVAFTALLVSMQLPG